jgi:hypothetical protein
VGCVVFSINEEDKAWKIRAKGRLGMAGATAILI